MVKNNLIITILFMTVLLLPIKAFAAGSLCDTLDLNNSESKCNANSSCKWIWDNVDAGSGHCSLKSDKPKCEDLSEEEKISSGYCAVCSYSVEIFSSEIEGNGKTTCTFTISPTGNRNSLIIKWNDPKSKKSGEFGHDGVENGAYHDSFMCYDESVFFWNANADLKAEGPGGLEEIIYPFKNKWNDIYTKTGQCPKIRYVNNAGNTYLYFPTEGNANEPPSTAGGSNEAGGEVEDEKDGTATKPGNNNNNSNDDDIDKIRDQYIGNMTCGGLTNFKFHKRIPRLTSTFYNLLKVAIPVLLVVKGMMDWFKAMSAGKEDEMKKNQKKFINRLIAGLCAFIVFILVETIIGWIAPKTGDGNAMQCVNCFINNSGCTEDSSSGSSSGSTTTQLSCPSGYTRFDNVCIKAQAATVSTSPVGGGGYQQVTVSCPDGWTQSNQSASKTGPNGGTCIQYAPADKKDYNISCDPQNNNDRGAWQCTTSQGKFRVVNELYFADMMIAGYTPPSKDGWTSFKGIEYYTIHGYQTSKEVNFYYKKID